MKIPFRTVGWFLLLALYQGAVSGYAAENFEYPELVVTPRASDRLEMEAKQEWDRRWTTHLPLQVSALTTFIAGITQGSGTDISKDPDKKSQYAGLIVGGGWLALSTWLALSEPPYTIANKDVSVLPHKTQREQLTRERMAEEAIHHQSMVGTRLRWLSAVSNLGVSAYMLSNSDNSSFAKTMDLTALVVSLAPLIFRYHWNDVAEEQSTYKKRIYGPVAQAGLLYDSGAGKHVPGLLLSLSF